MAPVPAARTGQLREMVIEQPTISIRPQHAIASAPFDRWRSPDGDTIAEFYRLDGRYLIRFPGRADFEVEAASLAVSCFAAAEDMEGAAMALLHNAVEPMIGNHSGRLHLHGSAVAVDGTGIAFAGLSRRGKTTLAASFARAGYPFLTEDVIALTKREDGTYLVAPARPSLRLFSDSEEQLFGEAAACAGTDAKREIDASRLLPFANAPVPLGGIYILGPGECEALTIEPVSSQDALAELMQHAFILDVEDKPRLQAHFSRCSDLALHTRCYRLDYPRDYDALPQIIDGLARHAREERTGDESE
ncbi:hypothetical protein [Alteraurantiacibacter aquimixticola]|uniref:hypothetical protein n=1 Tax=Alteraurantiacibacter aquimixticola TaxID=2489173 RepID=UPI00145B9FC5|nr:hypothetical protein [Alteraurantiacibacter aquimixticola]